MGTEKMTRVVLTILVVLLVCGVAQAQWSAPVLHDELNDGSDSARSPDLSSDGLTMYFVRYKSGMARLFEAYRASSTGPFTSEHEVTELYNGEGLYSPWVSADGLRMYYSEFEDFTVNTVLRMAERSSTAMPWTRVRSFFEIHADGYGDVDPSLTADELTMFFRSTRGGSWQIWKATRASTGDPFSNETLVSELNDGDQAANPSISPDGLMIYYAAIRGGRATWDIYKATRSSTALPFGNIQRVAVSTDSYDEIHSYVTPDESTLYFATPWDVEEGIWVSYRDANWPVPVAHWEFEEGGGPLALDSAGDNHGTLYGDTIWGAGQVGDYALDFDGDGDYVDLNAHISNIEGWNEGTIAGWFNVDEDRTQAIFTLTEGSASDNRIHVAVGPGTMTYDDEGFGYVIRRAGDTKLAMMVRNGEYYYTDGAWHHFAVTTGTGDNRIYIDGVSQTVAFHDGSSSTNEFSNINSPTHMRIGSGRIGNTDESFVNGKIDDVRIYDRALSFQEIDEIYTGDLPGPVAHWEFEEGGGPLALDSAGTNHGTLYGDTIWAAGEVGDYALDFDGDGDYVGTTYEDGPSKYTVSLWVSPNEDIIFPGFYGWRTFASKTGDEQSTIDLWSIWINHAGMGLDNEKSTSNYATVGFGPPSLYQGEWYHVAATCTTTQGKIYFDGELKNSVNDDFVTGVWDDSVPFNIARPYLGTADRFFNGKIDDVRIYDRVLSDAEIEQLYGGPIPEPEPTPGTYYVDGVNGSDLNDGRSLENAFATIQMGIDTATDGNTVLVYPDVYMEELNFDGKAITVASGADAATIEAPLGYAVSFYNGEEPNSVLKNFVIRNSDMAIFLAGSSPTLSNLTIVDNDYGIAAYVNSEPDISNCIFWNNTDGDLYQCEALHSWIQDANDPNASPGFADAGGGDYHLLSERGRYWPAHDVWVLDDVTSPCVDGGDPNLEPSGEPMPNGGLVNIGAYGDTAYASMSEWPLAGDNNRDGIVNMSDIAITANEWLERLPWAQ